MPDAVAVDETVNRIYVTNYVSDSMTIVDGATMRPVATVAVGHHPQTLAIDERRHRIFVANTHSNNVTAIDRATHQVLATLPGGMNPYAVAVDPERGDAYVANYGSQPVTKLDCRRFPTERRRAHSCIRRRAFVSPLATSSTAMVKQTARMIPGQPAFQWPSKYS
jgi:YVTN family beta-propeller protein